MARLVPIRALQYTEHAGALANLIAPPYDVINEKQRKELAETLTYNSIHLELAEPGIDRDLRVQKKLEHWLSSGILKDLEKEYFFAYEQEFEEAGIKYKRRTLFCGVESLSWEDGAVKPHEFTLSAPKVDRLSLLESTNTQFSPVFMLARDRTGQLKDLLDGVCEAGFPAQEGTVDGINHRIWVIEPSREVLKTLAPLLSESFYIADGHHRYETSYAYKKRKGIASDVEHPANYCLTGLVSAQDDGLLIRPLHRMIKQRPPSNWQEKLSKFFNIQEVNEGSTEIIADKDILAIGLDSINSQHRLKLIDFDNLRKEVTSSNSDAWLKTQSNILRYGVLNMLWGFSDDDIKAGAVTYTHLAEEVFSEVAEGNFTGFILNPITLNEVFEIADLGERLPQKSTYFHPKLGSGLLFYPLITNERE